mgnify:CR=1 FL=1
MFISKLKQLNKNFLKNNNNDNDIATIDNLIGDINKNRTEAKDFARLFNIQSLPDTPKNSYLFNRVDIIAVMLIMYSKIEDKYNYIQKDVYNTIVTRDIVQKYKIRNKNLFENLSNYLSR